MRRLAVVVLLSFSLGGCAGLAKFQEAFSIATTSVANPVTKAKLYKIETAVSLVFVGLETWKRSCVAGFINADCAEQIAAAQVYTRRLNPFLVQLRLFVKNDDQVNAVVVYNNIKTIIDTVKAKAAANDIKVE